MLSISNLSMIGQTGLRGLRRFPPLHSVRYANPLRFAAIAMEHAVLSRRALRVAPRPRERRGGDRESQRLHLDTFETSLPQCRVNGSAEVAVFLPQSFGELSCGRLRGAGSPASFDFGHILFPFARWCRWVFRRPDIHNGNDRIVVGRKEFEGNLGSRSSRHRA